MCHSRLIIVAAIFCCFLFQTQQVNGGNIILPLGIVFGQGTPEIQTAFKHALLTFNLNITTNPRDQYRFTAYVDTINTADAFKLSKLICNQFSRGIYALVGSMNSESFNTYHAFSNTFHMPLITPWYPSKESSSAFRDANALKGKGGEFMDYATRIRPDFNNAILETINYYGWKEVIYLYSTNEGLLQLQTLFHSSNLVKVKLAKKISSVKDAIQVLREIESAERFSKKYVLLDCPTAMAKDIIINHVRDVSLGRRTYHYLLAGLALDDVWESGTLEFNAVNITGLRMVDPNRKYVHDFMQKWSTLDTNQFAGAGKNTISANAAFMFDAMLIIKEAFTDILTDNPFAFSRYNPESACESGSDFLDDIRPFEYGQTVNEHLRRVQTEGLTGNIQFHENGTRKYFTVDIVELRENVTKVKIGQWSDFQGFRIEPSELKKRNGQSKSDNREYVVSTILEEPFLKLKSPSQRKNLSGNELYEGFMKDFADILFSKLGLKYRFQLVRDGKYGSKIPTGMGENWNGIVGELIRKEVDLAIAPLTITSERERVLEFSKPFLTQGISIMAFKPRRQLPGMFSFMHPLGMWVWLSLLGAYLGFSAVLYLIYKLTTAHAKQQSQPPELVNGDAGARYHNNHAQTQAHQLYLIQKKRDQEGLPLSTFLWMSFVILTSSSGSGSFLSRSISGRFASTVWSLFALILVSVYTGNYISIRMKNRDFNPIKSALDLVDRSGIQYGTQEHGTTFDFFRKSENQVYRAMYEHMNNGPGRQNTQTFEEGANLVRQRKGKYVFLAESAKIEYASNKRPCSTMKVGRELAEIQYGIGLPSRSHLTARVNNEILKLRESGVIRELEEKWWMNKVECQVANKLDALELGVDEDELSLGNMAGIFYILIIGIVIALLVSLVEYSCCRPKKESSKSRDVGSGAATATKTEMMVHHRQREPHSHHCHSSAQHQNAIIDSVPMPNDFCDISPDMNTK